MTAISIITVAGACFLAAAMSLATEQKFRIRLTGVVFLPQ